MRYRLLNHTADLRVQVYGNSLRQLFQNALYTLTDLLTDARRVRTLRSRRVTVRGEGEDLLLVRFLRELLFLFETRRFLGRRLEFLLLGDTILKAKVWGERFDPARHPLRTEVKAVTYHRLKVERRRERWVAEVIFDV